MAENTESTGQNPALTLLRADDRQAGQFRIAIREYEVLPTDERLVQEVTVTTEEDDVDEHGNRIHKVVKRNRSLTFSPGSPAAPTPRLGRMVFSETIEL